MARIDTSQAQTREQREAARKRREAARKAAQERADRLRREAAARRQAELAKPDTSGNGQPASKKKKKAKKPGRVAKTTPTRRNKCPKSTQFSYSVWTDGGCGFW